jgi:hypothetical protein
MAFFVHQGVYEKMFFISQQIAHDQSFRASWQFPFQSSHIELADERLPHAAQ